MRAGSAGRVRRLLAAAALLLTAACGTGPDAASGHGPAVLRVAITRGLPGIDVQQKLIQQWDAQHPDVRVQIIWLPEATDRTRSQVAGELESGDPDRYDVITYDVTYTDEFAARHLLEPLDIDVSKDFWAPSRESVRYRGKTWGVPWYTDAAVLFYRADLVHLTRPLTRWQDLRKAAADSGADRRVDALVSTQLKEYEGLTINAFEAAWLNDGEIIDGHGNVEVDSSTGAGAGIGELADGLTQQPPLFDPESVNSVERTSIERFLAGKVLAMRNWPSTLSWLEEDLHQRAATGTGTGVRYGVTNLPGPSVLGGWNLAVAKGGDHPDQAQDLIRYLSGSGPESCLVLDGYVPGRRSSFDGKCDTERYLGEAPGKKPHESAEIRQLESDHRKAVVRAIDTARPRPATPYYNEVSRDIQDVLGTFLRASLHRRGSTGKATDDTVGKATSELATRLKSALKGH